MGFSLIGKLGLDTGDYERALARSDVAYQQFGHKMEGFAKKQEKFLFKHLIGAFGVGAIEQTILATVDQAGQILEKSSLANKSTTVFQEMEAAAQMTGRSVEDLLKMTGKLPDDVARATAQFRAMGGAVPEEQLKFLHSVGQNMKQSGASAKAAGMSFLTGVLKPIDWAQRGAQVLAASFMSVNDVIWNKGRLTPQTREQWRYLHGGEDEEREVAYEETKGAGLDARRKELDKESKERRKRAKDTVSRILEEGYNKRLESKTKSEQVSALEKDLQQSIKDFKKLKPEDRKDAEMSIVEKRARLQVLRDSPEKLSGDAFQGRALQNFDPLNHIGGFGQFGDNSVGERIDRIARATEETAHNTRVADPTRGMPDAL